MRSLLALALPILLSACATAHADGASLAGSYWRFTTIDGAAPAADKTSLAFQEDRLTANAGCNAMSGTWRLENGKLVAGPLMSTKMACAGRMEQESAVAELLASSPALTLDENNDSMTLQAAGHFAALERTTPPE